jgi:fatty-acid desaturase
MASDLLSKKFLVFALLWSLILGFTVLGSLSMIVPALVLTPLIGVPMLIISIFAIIVVAHVITRAEYYNEYAMTKVYILVLIIFGFAGFILGLILPFLKSLI